VFGEDGGVVGYACAVVGDVSGGCWIRGERFTYYSRGVAVDEDAMMESRLCCRNVGLYSAVPCFQKFFVSSEWRTDSVD
jgi:hypothetical protein